MVPVWFEGRELPLFIFLLVAGLALANILLIALALLPLVMLLTARNEGPEVIDIDRESGTRSIWTGGEMEIGRIVRIGEGRALVIIKEALPPHASLVKGNNIKVLWKSTDPVNASIGYRLRFEHRGRYRINPSQVLLLAPTTDWPARAVRQDKTLDVMVRDRLEDLRAFSNPRSLPRLPLPDMATGIYGSQTTEFLELRPYVQGDRYRNINWKATSRSAREGVKPLVNQYKIEEDRSVLILLDNSLSMGVTSSGDDVFERCIHACLGLSQIYLSNRLDVGVMAIDSGEVVPPGSGGHQELRIAHQLLSMELTSFGGKLSNAVRAFPHQIRTGPLVVVVTSIRRNDSARIGDEIGPLRAAMGRRGKIILINVGPKEEPIGGIIGELALELAHLGVLSYQHDLADIKVPVYTWNPIDGDFTAFIKREFGVPG